MTRALRVVLVEFLPSGGMFQFSFLFAQALAEAGHRVTLLTGPAPELRSTHPNMSVIELLPTWHPNAPSNAGQARRKLRRIGRGVLVAESWRRVLRFLRTHRVDVVQFGELRFALDCIALVSVARLAPAGVVVDVAHNPVPYDVSSRDRPVEKRGRLSLAALDRAYRACDLVLALSERPRADLLMTFPDLPLTAVCGHGDYSTAIGAAKAGPPSDAPPRILFFGTWTKYKNLPLTLEAFALVRKELPDAGLTIAGPVMADVDVERLTERAHQIGNVDLVPGYVPLEELPALFTGHRAVVNAYDAVNVSGSIHMAYTFGRPVVATDVGAMRDVVDHEETGLLTAHNAAAVAGGLLMLLRDPVKADRLGAAGRRVARGAASWAEVAARADAAYERALAATGR